MWVAAVALLIAASWLIFRKKSGRPVPDNLRVGQPLPDFAAVDEQGDPVRSTDLAGSATVMLFVRGSWCPFCSSQVKNLTSHYKNIVDLGGKLIFVTPKPLETTRRVAQFFEVEFDFWLDESLAIAKQLGLLHQSAVPAEFDKEYGGDSVWPTTLVIDPAGIIRFVELSKQLSDRPDPKVLLGALRRAISA
jgi:peroxiredoxin